jgi:peptidoglycan/xylan/chitin deacetylase (PgdA/CDA1 family)
VVAKFLNRPKYLTTDQIKKMSDIVSFQSHTLSHAQLNKIKKSGIEKELVLSKNRIETVTGKAVNVLAYPFGEYNQEVVDIASKHFRYAVTTKAGLYKKTCNKLKIGRLYILRSDTLSDYIGKVQ